MPGVSPLESAVWWLTCGREGVILLTGVSCESVAGVEISATRKTIVQIGH